MAKYVKRRLCFKNKFIYDQTDKLCLQRALYAQPNKYNKTIDSVWAKYYW